MNLETKYTRIEYERRFLVSTQADWRRDLEAYSKRLEDKYLSNTRLRLRLLTDSDTGRQIRKLNKKLDSDSPYTQTVSRILLSVDEYELISRMDGHRLVKTRHYQNYLGRTFSLDVFEGELEGLILCETEAESLAELMSPALPGYIEREVTQHPFFKGGNLCRSTRTELAAALSELAAGGRRDE